MYFHTDDKALIGYLADVFKTAEETGTRIRLNVDGEGNLTVKRGEGVWSPPFASTADPYRDRTQGETLADRAARERAEGRIRTATLVDRIEDIRG